ncbi:GNAT family N-acetyltransferase [Flavivirga eckloniae]|uniref:GNAT family N-acetyltransferase n=1 Tax=Flavivirga eckloniae TaxID=1803846 RepID=A0A2K9PXD1_9FLAO|nr:GNAT family N-acetyltransferase [Flavivirga eckloniae]AUP81726.1 GNAT family N-acetyltransferase [Flavivirga eckloniae]
MQLSITEENPTTKDTLMLMEELSEILKSITGDSGKSSFSIDDLNNCNSFFLIARNKYNNPVGCGSIRQIDNKVGEIKRMYSKLPGVGKQILTELEIRAIKLGYEFLILETRKVNKRAVDFYLKNRYKVIPNYGKYIGNNEAICFQKILKKEN